jgi:hypothetical protein
VRNAPEPTAADLLAAYAIAHNRGVSEGDFRPLRVLFHRDAVLRFHGVPIGPFAGPDAIVAAFRARPPTDALRLLSLAGEGPGRAGAAYAWDAAPLRPAGTLRLEADAGLIRALDVFVDEPPF